MTSVGQEIYDMVESMMLHAHIDSPRFADYKIRYIRDEGKMESLQRTLDEAIETALKGRGEKNTKVARVKWQGDVYGPTNFAEAPLNKDELSQLEKQAGHGPLQVTEKGIADFTTGAMNVASNPAILGTQVAKLLPHAALVLLAIQLAPMIIEQMSSPGSMLDIRFKRLMTEEFNAFLDRQEQWATQIGTRQVWVQSTNGFLMQNGASMSESNLRQVREGGVDGNRIALIDYTDHAKELFSDYG